MAINKESGAQDSIPEDGINTQNAPTNTTGDNPVGDTPINNNAISNEFSMDPLAGEYTPQSGSAAGGRYMEILATAFADYSKSQNRSDRTVAIVKIMSSEQTVTSRIAIPCLVVAISDKVNNIVYMPLVIVEGREGDIDDTILTVGTETLSVPRFPSEVFDARMRADTIKVLSTSFVNTDGMRVTDTGAKCLFDLAWLDDEKNRIQPMRAMFDRVMRNLLTELLVNINGDKDISIPGLVAKRRTINITYARNAVRKDENGLPIPSSISAKVSVSSGVIDNDAGLSMNVGNKSTGVGEISIRSTLVNANLNDTLNQKARYIPQLVIEDISPTVSCSNGNKHLLLSALAPLMNINTVMRMFDPGEIGHLNKMVNLSNEKKPKAFSQKDMEANYFSMWQQMLEPGCLVAITLRMGTFSAVDCCGYINDIKSTNTMFPALMKFLGIDKGEATTMGDSCAVSRVGVELVPIGTYKAEDGSEHSLADIDQLFMIKYHHGRGTLVQDWAATCDGSMDPLAAFGMKVKIINQITNNRAKILDRGITFSLDPKYINGLRDIHNSQLAIKHNAAMMGDTMLQRWAPYGGINNTVELGMGGIGTAASGGNIGRIL